MHSSNFIASESRFSNTRSILNEENAKLEQKLQEMAPNLIAAELEREVVELKMELERTKAAANAVMANADMERRRREEEESSSGAAAGDVAAGRERRAVRSSRVDTSSRSRRVSLSPDPSRPPLPATDRLSRVPRSFLPPQRRGYHGG